MALQPLPPQADIHRKAPGSQQTALLLAATGTRQGHARAVEVLLRSGADVKDVDAGGNTALLLASSAGNEEVLAELFKARAGAIVDTANAAGVGPQPVCRWAQVSACRCVSMHACMCGKRAASTGAQAR